MAADHCKVKFVIIQVQENGLLRELRGRIIGHLNDDVDYQSVKGYGLSHFKCKHGNGMDDCCYDCGRINSV